MKYQGLSLIYSMCVHATFAQMQVQYAVELLCEHVVKDGEAPDRKIER